MTLMLDAAISYASRNLAVFPCSKKMPLTGNGFKDATCDATQILKWWSINPSAQIGLPTGKVNGLFVVDVDGPQGESALAKMNLPDTFTVETRPGRKQFWFAQPEGVTTKNSASAIAPQVDIRGDGGYCIAPPSIHHETGKPYRIVKDLPWAPAPKQLIETRAVVPSRVNVPDQIPPGQRHPTLLKIAGSLRARGLSPDMVLSQLEIVNERQCVPPLDRKELEKLAQYVGSKPAGFPGNRQPTTAETELEYYHAVERERVKWLWPGRVPAGKLTLFVGDPGAGKSLVTIDIAARLSTGRDFPDGHTCEQGKALILTAEDDARDTVGPRLDAAGADSRRIARIKAVTLADGSPSESSFSLERDLMKLEESLAKDAGFRLIVVDPLTAYLGSKLNSWRDSDVRAILTPLTDFAARTGIAVGGIMHMRKSETDAMLRVSGSIAFVAAARAVWGFAVNPEDETERVMVGIKCNLAALGNGLTYKIATSDNGAPYIAWQKEPCTLDAEDVLGGSKKEKRERAEKVSDAKDWLLDRLEHKAERQEQLKAEAKDKGLSWRTVMRAKASLRIRSRKDGFAGAWFWELPEASQGGHE